MPICCACDINTLTSNKPNMIKNLFIYFLYHNTKAMLIKVVHTRYTFIGESIPFMYNLSTDIDIELTKLLFYSNRLYIIKIQTVDTYKTIAPRVTANKHYAGERICSSNDK